MCCGVRHSQLNALWGLSHMPHVQAEGGRAPPGPAAPYLVFTTCSCSNEKPERRLRGPENADDPKLFESTASSAWGPQASELCSPPGVHTCVCALKYVVPFASSPWHSSLNPVLSGSHQMERGESRWVSSSVNEKIDTCPFWFWVFWRSHGMINEIKFLNCNPNKKLR